MIYTSISCGFGKDNRYNLDYLPDSIQIPTYKYDVYMEAQENILKQIKLHNITVRTVHLPLDTLKRKFSDIRTIIDDGIGLGAEKFIIHPNKNIISFLNTWQMAFNGKVELCIENFQWKKKKVLKSPLEIIDIIKQYSNMSMCLDTAHTEEIWFDYKLMYYLLKYTSVIHLSNREKGIGPHVPFTAQNGELKLVGFVRDLKYRYNWEGDIILEYLSEYKHKLNKNLIYLRKLLE